MRRCTLALALLAGLTGAGGAAAQASGPLPVRAFVIGTPIAIGGLRDLDFGTVTTGMATTVLPTSASAGAFIVTGEKNERVAISFTLPTELVHTVLGPGTTLPITFGPSSAIWRRRTNDPSGGTAFNPATGATGMLGPPVEPILYIWLGGTVNPPLAQTAGTYRATVVCTVAYTN